jgi:hypothetical protein
MTWTRYNLKFMESVVGIPKVGFHNVALSPCKLLFSRSKLTWNSDCNRYQTRLPCLGTR